MSYTSYHQVIEDLDYMNLFFSSNCENETFEKNTLNYKSLSKLCSIWMERMKEKFELSKNNGSKLARFLSYYPLPFKEFIILLELLRDQYNGSQGFYHEFTDPFRKARLRYEKTMLRKKKLVFRFTDSSKPMAIIYKVSYQAQLRLEGQKYTEEYLQLDLLEEAKQYSHEPQESLYYVIRPRHTFKELIVNEMVMQSLKTALVRIQNQKKIFQEWGLSGKISYGRGITLNFTGPPGTGKTLAAHCLANALRKKLLIVRYDQLQSRWWGETEKHIQGLFKIASEKGAVLFFDEADAIAHSRVSLEHSWEVSQVNTLLKELELFDGVCIFATNYVEKYDEAFERRLTMHIHFGLPDKQQALKILCSLLPKKACDKNLKLNDLDLSGLSGGHIKNIVLNAAGNALMEGSERIKLSHIEKALAMVKACPEKKYPNYIS